MEGKREREREGRKRERGREREEERERERKRERDISFNTHPAQLSHPPFKSNFGRCSSLGATTFSNPTFSITTLGIIDLILVLIVSIGCYVFLSLC